jgi:hypothetical protein
LIIHKLGVITFDILFCCTILKYIMVSSPAIPRHISSIINSITWVISELSSSLVMGSEFEFIELFTLLALLELRVEG